MKKKLRFLSVAITIVLTLLLAIPTATLAGSTETLRVKIGDTKYLRAGSSSKGTAYGWAWVTSDYQAVSIDGSAGEPGCTIKVEGYNSSPVVVHCTIYIQSLIGNRIVFGEDYKDYNIIIDCPSYTVTLDAAGGSVSPSTLKVYYDDTYGSLPTPSRSGYTFLGWYTAGGREVTGRSKIVTNADHTLYAEWKSNISTYTVSYNANGGSGAPGSQTKTRGTALTLSSAEPTHASSAAGSYTVTLNANGGSVSTSSLTAARTTSYSFKNWNTKSDGSGTSYASGGSYTADANATLYAQWNSSTATAPVTLPTPTKSGYIFKGWAEDSEASGGVTGSYTPTGNVTLFATWEKVNTTYTVAYDANGGSGAPASQKKTSGTALTLSSTKPTRTSSPSGSYTVTLNANGGSVSTSSLTAARTTSYSFKNWNTKSDGSGTSYASGGSYTADANATLYAQWNSSTSIASVLLPTPTKSGYQFKGWAEYSWASSGVTGSYTPDGNVTLHAIWEATQITGKWGNLNWTLDAQGKLTISGSGAMKAFDDSSSEAWHKYIDSIIEAVIEPGITDIGRNAFEWCLSMTSVTIPATVSNISESAFFGCFHLTDVYFGGSSSQWQGMPGRNWNSDLEEATVHFGNPDSSVNWWGPLNWTLSYDGVLTISGNGPIYDFDGWPTNAWHKFADSITKVVIQNGVTSIGAYAFEHCRNLKSAVIPAGVTYIGNCAFDGCYSLTSATIPASVTSIGDFAFALCGLTDGAMPASLTEIGDFAFEYNNGLTAVTIPANVRKIGTGAFDHCKNLTSIQVAAGNQAYSSLDGVLFNKNRTEILCCPGGRTGNYAIPAGVKTISDYAFSGCEALTGVTIPSGVTYIGDSAFCSCYALTSIKIPSGVTYVGEFAFSGCEKMKTITIPSGITAILDWTFAYCFGLTDVYFIGTEAQWNAIEISNEFNYPMLEAARHYLVADADLILPAALTAIESQAFANSTFKTVYVPPTVVRIALDAFGSRQDVTIVGVPGSYAEDYARARGFGFVSAP